MAQPTLPSTLIRNGKLASVILHGGTGKAKALLADLSARDPSLGKVVEFDFSPLDGCMPSHVPSTINQVADILLLDKDKTQSKRVIVNFKFVDSYEPCALFEISELINRHSGDAVFIFGCDEDSESVRILKKSLADYIVLYFKSAPLSPARAVSEHGFSDLHSYGKLAQRYSEDPCLLQNGEAQRDLKSLLAIVDGLIEMDGGLEGEKATNRGMDKATLDNLASFSRAFFGSEISIADEISRKIIKGFSQCSSDPYFVLVEAKENIASLSRMI